MWDSKHASVPITAQRLGSGSGWKNPKAETAPPGPSLHEPELDFSILRIYIVRKGARTTLNTERPRDLPASWEDHIREIPHLRSEAASSVASLSGLMRKMP